MRVLQNRAFVITAVGIMLVESMTCVPISHAAQADKLEKVEKVLVQESNLDEYEVGFEEVSLLEKTITDLLQDEVVEKKRSTTDVERVKKKEEIVLADVDYYLNIRKKASTKSDIIGKLYKDAIGTVVGKKDGWYLIESGSVKGYVKAEYVLTGEKARKKADEVGERIAIVDTTTLKVRKKTSLDAPVITLVGEGTELEVLKESKNWAKIKLDDQIGFVAKKYVCLQTLNEYAESKEEEAARLLQEQERLEQEMQSQQNSTNQSQSGSSNNNQSSSNQRPSKPSSQGSVSAGNKSLGQRIVNFAMQFRGNPYVYGGTSLTNGADCSGFVQSVFRNFGIALPRTSGAQGSCGRAVPSLSQAQPGDIIAYSGHVGIYIGSGKMIHASTRRTGIIVSSVNYRPIKSIRRIV